MSLSLAHTGNIIIEVPDAGLSSVVIKALLLTVHVQVLSLRT